MDLTTPYDQELYPMSFSYLLAVSEDSKLLIGCLGSGSVVALVQLLVWMIKDRRRNYNRKAREQAELTQMREKFQLELQGDLREEIDVLRVQIQELNDARLRDRQEFQTQLKLEGQRYLALLEQYNSVRARHFLMEFEMMRLRKYLQSKGIELPLPALEELEQIQHQLDLQLKDPSIPTDLMPRG